MKNIKDYLHLCTGCQMSTPYGECKFLYYRSGVDERRYNPVIVDRGDNEFAFKLHEVRPILRPLSDMTEEERQWCFQFEPHYNDLTFLQSLTVDAEITTYLLSKGFDLFGLIDAGLAIDKTTLKP